MSYENFQWKSFMKIFSEEVLWTIFDERVLSFIKNFQWKSFMKNGQWYIYSEKFSWIKNSDEKVQSFAIWIEDVKKESWFKLIRDGVENRRRREKKSPRLAVRGIVAIET